MPRPRKPPAPPPRQAHGSGSVAWDAARRAFRARLPRDLSGKRASRYFDTRPEAEAWLTSSRSRASDSFDPSLPTGAYLNYWYSLQVMRLKPSTRARYLSQLAAYGPISAIPIESLRADQIQGVLKGLDGRGLTRRYVYHVGRLLYRALASAVRWKILTVNPAEGVDLPDPERIVARAWDAPEVRRFLTAIVGHRFEAPFLLALCAGLRIGEILGTRWDDLDWSENTVRVERAELPKSKRQIGSTKSGRGRSVDVAPWVMARLRVLRDALAVVSPYVCGKEDGARWTQDMLRRDWYAVAAEAGCRRLPPHRGGRATFATGHMVAGTDLADLADMLGHASPAVTANAYLASNPNRRKAAAKRLGELFSEPESDDWDANRGRMAPGTR